MKTKINNVTVLGTSHYNTKAKEGCPSKIVYQTNVYDNGQLINLTNSDEMPLLQSGQYDILVELKFYQGKPTYLIALACNEAKG